MKPARIVSKLLLATIFCLVSGAAAALETVPERMLRAWDPVTFVFDSEVGPQAQDTLPEAAQIFDRWFEQPGEYIWIDRRTLQFRPAEPWPAYAAPTYVRGSDRVELHTLLEPPVRSEPASGSQNLRRFDTVVLALPTPVDIDTLRAQLTLTAAPLDPMLAGQERVIPRTAYSVKLNDDPQRRFGMRVTLTLDQPLALSHELTVVLRLGHDAKAPSWSGRYRTAGALRLTALGCANVRLPVAGRGSDYPSEEALQCASEQGSLIAQFSEQLPAAAAARALDAVHVLPDPGPMRFHVEKNLLHVSAEFAPGQIYRLRLDTEALLGNADGVLARQSASAVHVRFPPAPPALRWRARSGVVERFGVQQVPVLAQGVTHADLRLHEVAPLDRRYWPFPTEALTTNDLTRPAGPGEQPESAWDSPSGPSLERLRQHLRMLDEPRFSDLVPLATGLDGRLARGFDLKRVLVGTRGSVRPGTYLLGLRDAARSTQRDWMRIQVTDLALSTVSDGEAVRFVVTSLRSAVPLSGARVTVEGLRNNGTWSTFIDGKTNVMGAYEWRFADVDDESGGTVLRIVVRYGDDVLVLDPTAQSDTYQDNHWRNADSTWLQWTRSAPPGRRAQQQLLCHLFTERPVYKPEHPVHIKGWARIRERGAYESVKGKAILNIVGPGDRRWRVPVAFNDTGTFYYRFDEPDLPTGSYWVGLEHDGWDTCGGFEFAKREYVLPELEVSLHGASKVPLDAPFELTATGRFYAGGRVTGQPLRWRVTQFPYTFNAAAWRGFKFASTRAFSKSRRLESEAVVDRTDVLDATGAARVQIDPSAEPSARPRRYVIEATVTGTDGRTVTATRQVLGLPAMLPGIKVPQVMRRVGSVTPAFVVLGADGRPLAGAALDVRLKRREWHAQLRTGDHTGGVARYLTEPVDTEVAARTITSTGAPQTVPFEISRPGVYLLEASVRDRLGRLVSVTTDFFVASDALIASAGQTWNKAPGRTFKVTADKSGYAPADTAQLVLQSPYQSGRALMVIEDPRGNEYRWVDIDHGQALVEVALDARFAPRLPVHFLALRGRVSDVLAGADLDLGRPATAAATVMLDVLPTGQLLNVSLDYPATARPGQTVAVTVSLRDADDKPVAGEVSLWLVDQAVLALGRERRLNPVPDFVRPRTVRTRMRDTRSDLFGLLPLVVHPGGGAGDSEALDLLDNVTPRKDFVAVPYYEPSLNVPASGDLSVEVQLPDNLTVFKLRAKAITRAHRFGHATGSLGVRIPLVVQPALPAFVRPGDRFTGGAVIRAVDGKAGRGNVQVRAVGLDLVDSPTRVVDIGSSPARANFSFAVPRLRADEAADHKSGQAAPDHVEVTVAAERRAEGADPEHDAFSVQLPLVHTPSVEVRRQMTQLEPGASRHFAPVAADTAITPEKRRITRRVLASGDANVLHMASAGSFLMAYPYGCTEQRIAKATGGLALKKFADDFGWEGLGLARLLDGVDETLTWIARTRDANGLVGYWPGSGGVVSLTAWSLQFVIAARDAGHAIPEALELDLVRTLRRAVRSDFPLFLESSAFAERVWALVALADAGLPDAGYAAELARRAQFLPAESLAQVLRVLVQSGSGAQAELDRLSTRLWSLLRTRLSAGEAVYMGLDQNDVTSRLILPGETRAIAELLRTAVALGEGEARRALLSNALADMAGQDGWGSTNANAAAMSALGEHWQAQAMQVGVRIKSGARASRLLNKGALLTTAVSAAEPLEVQAPGDGPPVHLAVETRIENFDVPANTRSAAEGFVVRRTWLRVNADSGLMEAIRADADSAVRRLDLRPGDVIEEWVEVVNFADRFHVAVTAPQAAGLEALNPGLATAPAEATPSAPDSTKATYTDRRLSHTSWFFNFLPKGNHVFRTRLRAVTSGQFVLPPARAEAMYNASQFGRSDGFWVGIGTAG